MNRRNHVATILLPLLLSAFNETKLSDRRRESVAVTETVLIM
jgi:hypothetical protein